MVVLVISVMEKSLGKDKGFFLAVAWFKVMRNPKSRISGENYMKTSEFEKFSNIS